MSFSFVLCPECLAQYRALTHDLTCGYTLNILPFCSPVWSDEHPKDEMMEYPSLHHEECRFSILRLVGARTQLWKTGVIPDELKELLAEAQRVIPNWPGFSRLALSPGERLSLDDCAGELKDFFGAMAADFPEMTFTRQGGGVTKLSARRGEA